MFINPVFTPGRKRGAPVLPGARVAIWERSQTLHRGHWCGVRSRVQGEQDQSDLGHFITPAVSANF